MSDTPLLDWTPPYQRHSATSRAAAEAIKPHLGPMHLKIQAYLMGRAGATDEEMQLDLKMNGSTQRPRRIDMIRWGLVIDSGKTRATKSGRQAVVWMLRGRG